MAAMLLAGSACVAERAPSPARGPSVRAVKPTPGEGSRESRPRVCRPFPDRLIDEFLSAYNGRSAAGLAALVQSPVVDHSATPFGGTERFANVLDWAREGWRRGDRFRTAGYSAFSGGNSSFEMFVERRNRLLRRRGIDPLSLTLSADSSGCTIDRLRVIHPVQARTDPCRFYQEFGDFEAVARHSPTPCQNGTGREARHQHVVVWTGDEMIAYGGDRGGAFRYPDFARDGLAYRPAIQRWSRVPEAPLSEQIVLGAVWTGSEVVVVPGGVSANSPGAAFDPASRRWRRLAPFPFRAQSGATAVWSGSEVLLWGGSTPDLEDFPRRVIAYDPATDTWRRLGASPIAGRSEHESVWTGDEMIVWGGSNNRTDVADGAAYDPATDEWRRLPAAPLSPRIRFPIVWTGDEMIVWGGSSYGSSQRSGAAYDPATDQWRLLPRAPIEERHAHTATWTGTEVIVWGGFKQDAGFSSGAAYNPSTDHWRRISASPLVGRCQHSEVWTGRAVAIFGGYRHCGDFGFALGDGALYFPETDSWRLVKPRL